MSYLKKVRMLRAKELLSNPNVQIQQVAEQVGYISSRHFAKLFSEYFGHLPSEYRDSFRSR
jgi:two-component system response regulator YesN